MQTDDKKREFILSYLETQFNQVNLKVVRQLIEFGKNNNYSAPDILSELVSMDQKHEKILTATFELDYVDGVKLFSNKASHWLTSDGRNYLRKLKLQESHAIHSNFNAGDAGNTNTAYDGYLSQLIACKGKMQTEADKVTLQEFTIDLRHLLTDSKKLEEGALNKFQPFIERNWRDLATPMNPILVELSRRFLFTMASET